MTFGPNFSNRGEELQPGVFPNSLTHLIFDDRDKFNNGNKPLQSRVLPPNLTHLRNKIKHSILRRLFAKWHYSWKLFTQSTNFIPVSLEKQSLTSFQNCRNMP